LKEALTNTADVTEELFYQAINARDLASGETKTKLRKVTKHLDDAFASLEKAEDAASEI
jgi:hypothetical protein